MKSLLASICLCALLALAVAPAALAQRGGMNVPEHAARPVVMELFSSQGCGNCPAANANIAKLAERSDVIAITYPVGIWDYLGWDDTFAKPEFTERQKRYNRALELSRTLHAAGRLFRPPARPRHQHQGYRGDVRAAATSAPIRRPSRSRRTLVLVSGALPDKVTKAGVMLVHFRPGLTKVTPGGGANKGKAMTYWNLVTGSSSSANGRAARRSSRSSARPAASCWSRRTAPKACHRRGPEEVALARLRDRIQRRRERTPVQLVSANAHGAAVALIACA